MGHPSHSGYQLQGSPLPRMVWNLHTCASERLKGPRAMTETAQPVPTEGSGLLSPRCALLAYNEWLMGEMHTGFLHHFLQCPQAPSAHGNWLRDNCFPAYPCGSTWWGTRLGNCVESPGTKPSGNLQAKPSFSPFSRSAPLTPRSWTKAFPILFPGLFTRGTSCPNTQNLLGTSASEKKGSGHGQGQDPSCVGPACLSQQPQAGLPSQQGGCSLIERLVMKASFSN